MAELEVEEIKMRLYLVVLVSLLLGVFVSSASALDLAGDWDSTYKPNGEMATYTIFQSPGASTFSWTIHHKDIEVESVRNGMINGATLEIEYNRPKGPHATGDRWVKVTGTVAKQHVGRATEIKWANRIVWSRE